MRAHIFQHVPFEGLGSIQNWLEKAGSEITWTRFFESVERPDPAKLDLLVVLGGPMSVNDEGDFPWLISEKEWIREAIHGGTPVLGICLGAQLIASAMDARVYRNPQKEIGWFSIEGVSSDNEAVFQFPASTQAFHWHGETFDLPPDAIHLARSRGCENQAYQLGRSTIGLQFHLETTPEAARYIIENCRHELVPSTYVQTEKEILSADPQCYRSINQLMENILSYLVRGRG